MEEIIECSTDPRRILAWCHQNALRVTTSYLARKADTSVCLLQYLEFGDAL